VDSRLMRMSDRSAAVGPHSLDMAAGAARAFNAAVKGRVGTPTHVGNAMHALSQDS
jgi:hypothetical protein